MKAKLKNLNGIDFELDSFWPDDEDNFCIYIRAMIGPDDADGEESFDIQVCTLHWLKSQIIDEKVIFGFQMMIVSEYDVDIIKAKIIDFCETCSGNNWKDIGTKLNLIGTWEFQDYKPYAL
ncbi:immunity 8 family protein [Thalassotalea piscium]|uniref:Immunity protein 8 n=1 Tax=Thalassotalea piscium TaxID=1230533 RepID=A0A7X0NKF1_9GAMM|nr:immunity 8 family protein [Thalassotalea piscium]MBB6545073.1 hypothetical protein [Thalassotalea piscium]